jgi:hypothetical protein
MSRTEKMWVWLGGLVLGAGAIAGVAYAASSKPSTAQLPSAAPVTAFNPTTTYIFASKVPSTIHDPDSLMQALAAAGWTNITIGYFGPTGSVVQGLKIPFTVDTSMYVAAATWNGPANAPIPPGVSAVLSST